MLLRLPHTSIYVGETTRFSLRMRGVSAIAFVFTANLDVLVFPDTTMQIEIDANFHYHEIIYYELYVTVRDELRQAKKTTGRQARVEQYKVHRGQQIV